MHLSISVNRLLTSALFIGCAWMNDLDPEELITLPFLFYVLYLRVLLHILLNMQGEL